jgi:hypothetical protein
MREDGSGEWKVAAGLWFPALIKDSFFTKQLVSHTLRYIYYSAELLHYGTISYRL